MTQEQPEKPISITLDETENLIACALYMSGIKLKTSKVQNSQFHVFQMTRFKGIKRFMHFNNNSLKNVEDKLDKLPPVIDKIGSN